MYVNNSLIQILEQDSKGKDDYNGSLDISNQRTSFADFLDSHNTHSENIFPRGMPFITLYINRGHLVK